MFNILNDVFCCSLFYISVSLFYISVYNVLLYFRSVCVSELLHKIG